MGSELEGREPAQGPKSRGNSHVDVKKKKQRGFQGESPKGGGIERPTSEGGGTHPWKIGSIIGKK